jgi:hypothetical protein
MAYVANAPVTAVVDIVLLCIALQVANCKIAQRQWRSVGFVLHCVQTNLKYFISRYYTTTKAW